MNLENTFLRLNGVNQEKKCSKLLNDRDNSVLKFVLCVMSGAIQSIGPGQGFPLPRLSCVH